MSGFYNMMTLGGFQFGISTAAFQELRRATEYRWASQNRFAGKPAVQFVGNGDETISLPGVIYPEWKGGKEQLSQMRQLAAGNKPLLMIDGQGVVMGNWVIERVEEEQSNFAQGGVARKQQFTLSLKKFGDLAAADPVDSMGLGKISIPSSVTALPAISSSLSAASSPADILKSVTSTANAAFSAAKRLSTNINVVLTNVSRVASSLGIHSPAITKALTRSQDVANNIGSSARFGLSLMGRVQTAAAAGSAVNNMFNDSTTQRQLASTSSGTIKASLATLTSMGASPDALAVVRSAMVSANKVTALASALTDSTNTIKKAIGS